jgi:tight adherence protein B
MTSFLLLTVTILAGVVAVVAGYFAIFELFLRERSRIHERLQDSFSGGAGSSGRTNNLLSNLPSLAEHAEFKRPGLAAWASTAIDQSALGLTLRQCIVISTCVGAAVSLLILAVTQHWLLAIVGILPATALLPVLIYLRRRRRTEQLVAQLPDAFDVMGRSLKAGQTVIGAMDIIARDSRGPLAEELRRCRDQLNLGLSQEVALRDLARRTGVMELQILVVSLLVQRRSGGNLVEILSNLATVVRKRLQLRAKVKALTGEGRMQALVLMVLPVLMFGVILFINNDYAQELVERPGLLAAVIASQVVGSLWIRRIVSIDY